MNAYFTDFILNITLTETIMDLFINNCCIIEQKCNIAVA